MSFCIRPERPEDFPRIHELVRLAFAAAEHADGDEHFLVDRLRRTPNYIPELSLVAEDQGQLVGHIMFSTVRVGEAPALAVAPLSVLPGHQRRGIGGALLRTGHEQARALGWRFVVLVGSPAYYPRFGYKPASTFGVRSPFDLPEDVSMVINLGDGPDHLPGMVEYASAFFPQETGQDGV